jgi:high-affinity Fe2+/Pb2+ permease
MRSLFEVTNTSSNVTSIDEISCIHGIKTLCWLGVLLAHVTTFLFFVGGIKKSILFAKFFQITSLFILFQTMLNSTTNTKKKVSIISFIKTGHIR